MIWKQSGSDRLELNWIVLGGGGHYQIYFFEISYKILNPPINIDNVAYISTIWIEFSNTSADALRDRHLEFFIGAS